jgi:hypothetical protein
MYRIRVAVAVADEALERLEQVARACRELGFHVDSTLTSVGILTGFIEIDRIPLLRAVPGVAAVEPERPITILRPRRSPWER